MHGDHTRSRRRDPDQQLAPKRIVRRHAEHQRRTVDGRAQHPRCMSPRRPRGRQRRAAPRRRRIGAEPKRPLGHSATLAPGSDRPWFRSAARDALRVARQSVVKKIVPRGPRVDKDVVLRVEVGIAGERPERRSRAAVRNCGITAMSALSERPLANGDMSARPVGASVRRRQSKG